MRKVVEFLEEFVAIACVAIGMWLVMGGACTGGCT